AAIPQSSGGAGCAVATGGAIAVRPLAWPLLLALCAAGGLLAWRRATRPRMPRRQSGASVA
ncbi:MAG: hypothetical protein ABI560_15930, partial [Myxococcales bacterium]